MLGLSLRNSFLRTLRLTGNVFVHSFCSRHLFMRSTAPGTHVSSLFVAIYFDCCANFWEIPHFGLFFEIGALIVLGRDPGKCIPLELLCIE